MNSSFLLDTFDDELCTVHTDDADGDIDRNAFAVGAAGGPFHAGQPDGAEGADIVDRLGDDCNLACGRD